MRTGLRSQGGPTWEGREGGGFKCTLDSSSVDLANTLEPLPTSFGRLGLAVYLNTTCTDRQQQER